MARLFSAWFNTARTCSRFTPGNHSRKSSTLAPSSRFSKSAFTIDRDLNGVLDADEPRPSLQISLSSGKTLLSWPLAAAGFTLQQAGSLDAGAWANNTNPVEIVGSSNLVTNDGAAATLYFRLRK